MIDMNTTSPWDITITDSTGHDHTTAIMSALCTANDFDLSEIETAAEVEAEIRSWLDADDQTMTVEVTRFETPYELFDSRTGEKIGPATADQIDESLGAAEVDGGFGGILIDADGNVIADGTWAAQQPGVRAVFVA